MLLDLILKKFGKCFETYGLRLVHPREQLFNREFIAFQKEIKFVDQRFERIVISVADGSDQVQELDIEDLVVVYFGKLPHKPLNLLI